MKSDNDSIAFKDGKREGKEKASQHKEIINIDLQNNQEIQDLQTILDKN